MREFDTGATRDSEDNKIDYEGFLSPCALRRYGEYMNKHRIQADGKTRDSDNWQKGIPLTAYMKSLWRHLVELWSLHRQGFSKGELGQDSLCAIIFNASGYLHEIMKDEGECRVFTSTPQEGPNSYLDAIKKELGRDAEIRGESLIDSPEPDQVCKEKK